MGFLFHAFRPCPEISHLGIVYIYHFVDGFQFPLGGPCVDLFLSGQHFIEDVFDLGGEGDIP